MQFDTEMIKPLRTSLEKSGETTGSVPLGIKEEEKNRRKREKFDEKVRELKEEAEAVNKGERRLVPNFFGGNDNGFSYKLVHKDAALDDYGEMPDYSLEEVRAAGFEVLENEEEYIADVKEGLREKGWKIAKIESPHTRKMRLPGGGKALRTSEKFAMMAVVDADGKIIDKLPWQEEKRLGLSSIESDVKWERLIVSKREEVVDKALELLEKSEKDGVRLDVIPCKEGFWSEAYGSKPQWRIGSVDGLVVDKKVLQELGVEELGEEVFRNGLAERLKEGSLKVVDLEKAVEVFDPKTGNVLAHEDMGVAEKLGWVKKSMEPDADRVEVIKTENERTNRLEEAIKEKTSVVAKLAGAFLQTLREAYGGAGSPIANDEKYDTARKLIDGVVDRFVGNEKLTAEEKVKIVKLAAKAMFLGLS